MNTLTQSLDLERTSPSPQALEALYSAAFMFLDADRVEDATRAFRVMVRFAPTDERAWLGLGACHERRDEDDIAAELYGAGSVVASPPSPRCFVALARIERARGESEAADEHLGEALVLAEALDDDDLIKLVALEPRDS